MFFHIFSYRLKCLLRDKDLVFWTLLFPILLATLFNLAFSNLAKQDDFNTINIAVIDNEQYKNDANFKITIESTTAEKGKNLFNITLTTKEGADALLKDNKIDGYLLLDNEIKIIIKQNGLNQTIIKTFVDQYNQIGSAVHNIMKTNPAAIQNGLIELASKETNYIKEGSVSNSKPNTIVNYFYTLIAMACLYGGFWGMKEMNDIQADLSAVGARVNLTPVHKLKVYIYRFLSALLVHFSEILIVLAYIRFGLNISFGTQTLYVILACFVGCLTGISFGSFVGAVVKKGEGIKTAILIGVTMTLSFLSGMMFSDMKYLIESKAPILGYLNPANLITDAFYSLYYYDTHTRFFINIAILVLFIIVFSTITYFIVRRQKYASL